MRRLPVAMMALVLALSLAVVATAESKGKEKPAPKPAAAEKKPEKKPEPKEAAPKPEAEKPAAKPAAAEGTTVTVTKGPFKIEVALDGYFQAQDAAELAIRTKGWADLEVVDGLKHGAKVQKGDVLVRLNMEKIDDAISDARTDFRVADLTVRLAELDLNLLQGASPIEVAATDRNHNRFVEDYDRFQKIDLPLARKSADYMLRMSQEYLDMEKEELRQLEKMYKADDLVEDTEEIILKRQRFAVDFAEFRHEQAKLSYEETLKLGIPRRVEDNKDVSLVEELRYQRAKEAAPLTLEKAKADLEKAKMLRAKAQEKLDNLTADREAMIVKAPTEGVLYYGRSTGGKFSGSDGETFRRGDKVVANQVFLTVVKTRPVVVAADVPEDKLYAVRPGMKAKVEPKGFPDLKAQAVVAEVAGVPVGEGKFRARLSVVLDKDAEAVLPGMACKVKLVPYARADALTVPKAAVEEDELDEDQHFVYVAREGQEPKKQAVTLGKESDKKVEITAGLSAGEKVLAEPPKKK